MQRNRRGNKIPSLGKTKSFEQFPRSSYARDRRFFTVPRGARLILAAVNQLRASSSTRWYNYAAESPRFRAIRSRHRNYSARLIIRLDLPAWNSSMPSFHFPRNRRLRHQFSHTDPFTIRFPPLLSRSCPRFSASPRNVYRATALSLFRHDGHTKLRIGGSRLLPGHRASTETWLFQVQSDARRSPTKAKRFAEYIRVMDDYSSYQIGNSCESWDIE